MLAATVLEVGEQCTVRFDDDNAVATVPAADLRPATHTPPAPAPAPAPRPAPRAAPAPRTAAAPAGVAPPPTEFADPRAAEVRFQPPAPSGAHEKPFPRANAALSKNVRIQGAEMAILTLWMRILVLLFPRTPRRQLQHRLDSQQDQSCHSKNLPWFCVPKPFFNHVSTTSSLWLRSSRCGPATSSCAQHRRCAPAAAAAMLALRPTVRGVAAGEAPGPTAAFPIDNPYCICKANTTDVARSSAPSPPPSRSGCAPPCATKKMTCRWIRQG